MSLYNNIYNICMLVRDEPKLNIKIEVNMKLKDFIKEEIPYKINYDYRYFCGFKITELENSFIIGERRVYGKDS